MSGIGICEYAAKAKTNGCTKCKDKRTLLPYRSLW